MSFRSIIHKPQTIAMFLVLAGSSLAPQVNAQTDSIQVTSEPEPKVAIEEKAAEPSKKMVALPTVLNRPPTVALVAESPAKVLMKQIHTRERHPLLVKLMIHDEDGDEVEVKILKLPKGARFDVKSSQIHWTPLASDIGDHEVLVFVRDSQTEVAVRYLIKVEANALPSAATEFMVFRVGQVRPTMGTSSSIARDANRDALQFKVIRAPAKMTFYYLNHSIHYRWTPTKDDIGDHEIIVDVADDLGSSRITFRAAVVPLESKMWNGAFLPEAGMTSFVGTNDKELRLGASLGVTLFAGKGDGRSQRYCAQETTGRGFCWPSHHRFYLQMEGLDTVGSEAPMQFLYSGGFALSFELSPARRWLIPTWGAEVGGMFSSETGHKIQTRPYLGALLWASPSLWVNATLGYRIFPEDLAGLSGASVGLSAMLAPW